MYCLLSTLQISTTTCPSLLDVANDGNSRNGDPSRKLLSPFGYGFEEHCLNTYVILNF